MANFPFAGTHFNGVQFSEIYLVRNQIKSERNLTETNFECSVLILKLQGIFRKLVELGSNRRTKCSLLLSEKDDLPSKCLWVSIFRSNFSFNARQSSCCTVYNLENYNLSPIMIDGCIRILRLDNFKFPDLNCFDRIA